MDLKETVEQEWTRERKEAEQPLPGLVAVFASGRPALQPLPLPQGAGLIVGRGMPFGRGVLDDPCMSRRHVEVSRAGLRWSVKDLGSRNGSAIDGRPLRHQEEGEALGVLRTGDTLYLFANDLRPFLRAGPVEERDGTISGPSLQRALERIAAARQGGDVLHIRGETGTGKELAARAFHAGRGPFVAVNCAGIPAGLAERLLFGARKGAFSGADSDSEGFLQAADGGTLFLDEIAELDLLVQAKLLRVLETREVLQLGSSKPRKVSLRVCSATHADLRARAAEGRFREDLFFRLGRPDVELLPLRERREEIPWHFAAVAAAEGAEAPVPHVSVVEAALLRRWPGNLRELRLEAREASRAARAAGRAGIEAADLGERAGREAAPSGPAQGGAAASRPGPAQGGAKGTPTPERGAIEAALLAHGGNVTSAAAALGLHRNQLRRLLERDQIDAQLFRPGGPAGK